MGGTTLRAVPRGKKRRRAQSVRENQPRQLCSFQRLISIYTCAMAKSIKPLLYVLLASIVGICGFVAFCKFFLVPRLKPMANYNRTFVLMVHLSELSSEDFRAVGLPSDQSQISPADIRLLCDRLQSTGRFPQWESTSNLEDLYGYPFVFSISRNETHGTREFSFHISAPGSPYPHPVP